MDMKVSRKETRLQPSGPVEVLVSNIFDIYPIMDTVDQNLIVDIEVLNDQRTELLDRCLFGTVKQRGADPLDITSGVQWAESIIGEVPVPVIMQQVQKEVQNEGPGVQVTFSLVNNASGQPSMAYAIQLTNAT